jgi:hypothetical protein
VSLSPARAKALEWFEKHGPACLFGKGDPSRLVRMHLEREGYVRPCARTSVGWTYFEITDKGREALAIWRNR